MKKILLLGAGKSAHVLLQYFSDHASQNQWEVYVGDVSLKPLQEKVKHLQAIIPFEFDFTKPESFEPYIQRCDIVVSMLPATMHIQIARCCLMYRKHLITPSYVSDEMASLHEEAAKQKLIFLNEMGLDPGIDHMSAMKLIHHFKQEQYTIHSFKSYCGGLIAPESDNNPWHYKFTWNPRNVLLAGQGKGGIKYLEGGRDKYIPFYNLFKHINTIELESMGTFEGYPNRDSLKYLPIYQLEGIQTMTRGTLRKGLFCRGWDVLVQLGLTEDIYELHLPTQPVYADFIKAFIRQDKSTQKENLEDTLQYKISDEVFQMLEWLGLFDETKPLRAKGTPAQILQAILEEKWALSPQDKDMIVMIHEFELKDKNGKEKKVSSVLTVCGEDAHHTAMAKTVGLPIGIACKYILSGRWNQFGIILPITPEIYLPVLEELESLGIVFSEY